MTRAEIIRMALDHFSDIRKPSDLAVKLEFVAAEKERQMIRDGWRQCAEGQSTTQFCGLLEEAVKAEREACAKYVAESFGKELVDGRDVAAAIRARGEK